MLGRSHASKFSDGHACVRPRAIIPLANARFKVVVMIPGVAPWWERCYTEVPRAGRLGADRSRGGVSEGVPPGGRTLADGSRCGPPTAAINRPVRPIARLPAVRDCPGEWRSGPDLAAFRAHVPASEERCGARRKLAKLGRPSRRVA